MTCSHKNWVQEQADALAAVVGYLELTNQSFPVPDLPREVLRLMSYIKNPVDTTWPKPLCKAIFPSISISIYIYIFAAKIRAGAAKAIGVRDLSFLLDLKQHDFAVKKGSWVLQWAFHAGCLTLKLQGQSDDHLMSFRLSQLHVDLLRFRRQHRYVLSVVRSATFPCKSFGWSKNGCNVKVFA